MEQRTILTNLKSNTGNRFLIFTQYALSMAGTNGFTSTMGVGGIVIPVLSLLVSLIIGAMQPEYNPVKQTISQLVLYPYGWLQATDFLVLGIWLLLLAVKFYSDFRINCPLKLQPLCLVF